MSYGLFCIIFLSTVLCISANETTLSWWQKLPQKLTDLLTMKINLFTALPLEMAATAIDTLCECNQKDNQANYLIHTFRLLHIIHGSATSNNSGYNKNAPSVHDAMS